MYGTNPLAQERLKIETYLWMPEYPGSRSYVIDRIQALARSGGLASFQWDVSTSGTTGTALFSQSLSSVVGFFTAQRSINDKQSSTSTSTATPSNNNTTTATNTLPVKVPSDAEIVVHLVCKFFDEQMGGWNNAFTTKYYVGVEQKPDSTASIQILQKSKSPPHYNIMYRNKIFEVYPKRNNVFHMFSLFAYIVFSTAGGYLGLLNLGGKSIGMVTESGIEELSP
ncbi:hypothetical protein HDU99_006326, partial [Rhizoclosmatium hyalinum]